LFPDAYQGFAPRVTAIKREVVITGIGPILPNCDSSQKFWGQIKSGSSQLSTISDPSSPDESLPAGRISDFDPQKYISEIPPRYLSSYSPLIQHYLASVFLARDDAGLQLSALAPERIGIYEGSSRGAIEHVDNRIRMEAHQPAREVYSRQDLISGINGQTVGVAAALLNVCGPTLSLSGTCCSGAMAAGLAFRDIRDGLVDAAFATGHDRALTPALFASYGEAQLISREPDPTQPSTTPYGNEQASLVFGEGAVTLALEEYEHAKRRGARILAKVSACAQGNEGRNPRRIGMNTDRFIQLLESVFETARIHRDETGFVVGHGNGVPVSDAKELECYRRFFGKKTAEISLISVKPVYGHILGGSSAANIAAAALMLHHGYIIPTVNGADVLSEDFANVNGSGREAPGCRAGVACSWGMGGHLSAVLFEAI